MRQLVYIISILIIGPINLITNARTVTPNRESELPPFRRRRCS